MLMAIQNGERISALDALKYDTNGNKNTFYCPVCNEELILRQGTKNIWHFAHKRDTECALGQGESLQHHLMKIVIKELIESNHNVLKSENEYFFGDYIADYYCEIKISNIFNIIKKVAVECVYKNTDINHFRAKNRYYFNNNIYVLWLFDVSIFQDENEDFKDEYRINEILKEVHTIHYGHIYAIDTLTKELYAIHFESAERYNKWNSSIYYLKRTKVLYPTVIDKINILRYISNDDMKFLPFKVKSVLLTEEKW